MSNVNPEAEIARLTAENEKLRAAWRTHITLKVSEKGGVSVYGLGRFPVTLYREQWEKLLNRAEEIRVFMAENESKLTNKADKKAA
jgi:hypothetical protein